jgi:hypothetical protein
VDYFEVEESQNLSISISRSGDLIMTATKVSTFRQVENAQNESFPFEAIP